MATVNLTGNAQVTATGSGTLTTLLQGCPPPLTDVLVGDYDQGKVRRTFHGDASDDGVPVPWMVLTRPVVAGGSQQRGYFRRLVLKVTEINDPTRPISVRTIFGPVVTGAPRMITRDLRPPSVVGLALEDLFYNSECDLSMSLGLIATNVRAHISDTGLIRIRALSYHLRAKPLTRSSVYA